MSAVRGRNATLVASEFAVTKFLDQLTCNLMILQSGTEEVPRKLKLALRLQSWATTGHGPPAGHAEARAS